MTASAIDLYDGDILEKELYNKEVLAKKQKHNLVSGVCLDWVAGKKICNICGKKYAKKSLFNKTAMTVVRTKYKEKSSGFSVVAYICKECITDAIVNDHAAYDEKIKAYDMVHDKLIRHHGYHVSIIYANCGATITFMAILAAIVAGIVGSFSGISCADNCWVGLAIGCVIVSLIPASKAICGGRDICKDTDVINDT